VFLWNYKAQQDTIINQGGTSSGKTYSILQVLLLKAMEEANQVVTITGEDMPNLRVGAMRDLETILRDIPFFKQMVAKVNRSEKIWILTNGSIIEFKTYDTYQDAKSGKRDYLFLNEANGIKDFAIYEELAVRTRKQVYVDYNPTSPFWVHSQLLGTAGVVRFISNFTHNKDLKTGKYFIAKKTLRKILAYKKDRPKRWKVYGLGLTGLIDGVIFPDMVWTTDFPKEIDKHNISYGLDFGFTNDPTVLVKLGELSGNLYAEKLIYDYHLKTNDIIAGVKAAGLGDYDTVYCDSNELRTIDSLNDGCIDLGIRFEGAYKGPDSVRAGIEAIKNYNNFVGVADKDFKHEQSNYCYKYDKVLGRHINAVVKGNDHIFDAIRYGRQGLGAIGGILASG
jgi:phage terminase large subunit